jgi:hypothetical protein
LIAFHAKTNSPEVRFVTLENPIEELRIGGSPGDVTQTISQTSHTKRAEPSRVQDIVSKDRRIIEMHLESQADGLASETDQAAKWRLLINAYAREGDSASRFESLRKKTFAFTLRLMILSTRCPLFSQNKFVTAEFVIVFC